MHSERVVKLFSRATDDRSDDRPTKKLHDSFTVHFEAKNSYSVPTYFFL